MKLRKAPTLLAVLLVVGLITNGSLWFRWLRDLVISPGTVPRPVVLPLSSVLAFKETYLDPAAGIFAGKARDCSSCHPTKDGLSLDKWRLLRGRGRLDQAAWSREIALQGKCGICHALPAPAMLPSQSWGEVISRMELVREMRHMPKLPPEQLFDIRHYYYSFSRELQRGLDEDPEARKSPLTFEPTPIGLPVKTDWRERPILGHVELVDLDHDGLLDVLATDMQGCAVTWIHRTNGVWNEAVLASVPTPARARLVPATNGGPTNIVVACLGAMVPTDDLIGSVVLLVNDGPSHYTPMPLVRHLARVADVQPGDFDGDGDVDFVVAAYGFINQGEIGWLENKSGGQYEYHLITKKSGGENVLPIDLNGDGRLDFVALFAQEHEEISVFINDGQGGFQERTIFKAATPSFGSSGIVLVDLDGDGDMDILFTNGDNMDLPTVIPRPFHGVQWLENQGNLKFAWHDIYRCYGAYCAIPADLNGDGKLDVVLTSMFNDWKNLKRASILWLENDGKQHFTPHTIATQPIHLTSAAAGDVEGLGRNDVVTCGMNAFPPFERMARVTLWKNLGARQQALTNSVSRVAP
jgi:hypothetical protein